MISKEEENLEDANHEADKKIELLIRDINAKASKSSKKLQPIVNQERAKGQIEFYKSILSMTKNEDDIKTYKDKIKEKERYLAEVTGKIEEFEKKNKEANKDEPEVQSAEKKIEKLDKKEETTKDEPKVEEPKKEEPKKEEPKKEQPEVSKVTEPKKEEPKKVPVTNEPKKEDPKKAVKKDESAREYKIRIAEEKLKGMENALSKKKEEASKEEDPAKKEKLNKIASNISQNIETAKTAISDAKSKANESEESDLWAIDVILSLIESQIDNFGENDFSMIND